MYTITSAQRKIGFILYAITSFLAAHGHVAGEGGRRKREHHLPSLRRNLLEHKSIAGPYLLNFQCDGFSDAIDHR